MSISPQLNALRVFTAVCQHTSFTRAAQALHITQSAVSRHIANLEKTIQRPLFDRQGPKVLLTPTGQQLYDNVKDAMITIELAVQQLTQKNQLHGRLQVRTSMHSLAITVLVPMLGTYTRQTGVHIDLVTSLAAPNANESFDVLISRDLTLAESEHWELIHEELVCVGSPRLIEQYEHYAPASWPLVVSRSRPDTVTQWALTHDISPEQLSICTRYDHLFFAISAAIAGLGFLVVPKILVLDALQNHTLILAPASVPNSGGRYFSYINPQTSHLESARHFCRWIKKSLKERSGLVNTKLIAPLPHRCP